MAKITNKPGKTMTKLTIDLENRNTVNVKDLLRLRVGDEVTIKGAIGMYFELPVCDLGKFIFESTDFRADKWEFCCLVNYDLDSKHTDEYLDNLDLTKYGVVAKNETTEDPIWKPEKDQIYWHVEVYGTVRKEHYCESSVLIENTFDEIQYERGNVFETKEAAQRMADRRKRIGIFENKMMEFADGYEFNFEVDVEKNFELLYFV